MILKRLRNKITKYNLAIGSSVSSHELSRHMNADILAYAQLSKLLGDKYIPITEYSLRPYTIAHILNDILINKRKIIVEFGSGISTIFIHYLNKKYNLGIRLLSFDHDQSWQKTLHGLYLNKNDDSVELIHAPLGKTKNGVKNEQLWYEEQIVNQKLANIIADLIIIDGPPGGEQNEYARYPAIEIVKRYLNIDGMVVVDDISRVHEKKIVTDLESLDFKANWSLRHCMLSKNTGFNTNPFGKALYK